MTKGERYLTECFERGEVATAPYRDALVALPDVRRRFGRAAVRVDRGVVRIDLLGGNLSLSFGSHRIGFSFLWGSPDESEFWTGDRTSQSDWYVFAGLLEYADMCVAEESARTPRNKRSR